MTARMAKKVWGAVNEGKPVRWTTEGRALANRRVTLKKWSPRAVNDWASKFLREELYPLMMRRAQSMPKGAA